MENKKEGGQKPHNQIVPTVIEQTQGQSRAYDIYSRLLEDRIIFLGGKIGDAVANTTIAQFLFLANKSKTADIDLYINSPGGSVTAGLAIYDAMQHVPNDVNTYCVGIAGSMGAVLLAGGTDGKRYSLPHGEVLLHQVMGGAKGQAADIEISANHILNVKDRINKILAKHTGQPMDKIEEDTDRDFYMNAEEAKEYGVIDKVIKGKQETED